MALSKNSLKNLEGVRADLIRVAKRADELTDLAFIITEGLRTRERQEWLFARKLTRTMNSRHLTGHAIDFAPLIEGEVSWKWPAFIPIAKAFKAAAKELAIEIEWGGDWKSFPDGPHIQLNRKQYP